MTIFADCDICCCCDHNPQLFFIFSLDSYSVLFYYFFQFFLICLAAIVPRVLHLVSTCTCENDKKKILNIQKKKTLFAPYRFDSYSLTRVTKYLYLKKCLEDGK